MRFNLAIGNGFQELDIPDSDILSILLPEDLPEDRDGKAELRKAMQHPIGKGRLHECVNPGESVAIIVSDITRPCPTSQILPSVLEELHLGGIKKDDITIVFALGSHRKQTPEEMIHLVGEETYNNYRCEDSKIDDCIHMGKTSSGTPVDITRRVAEANRIVCIGNIEYHYFAGYSGGVKALMPGVSTNEAIQENHSMMVRPEARAGSLEGNPVREDIEEAGTICGIDYIVNVVLDTHKQIIFATAGDPVKAHRAGCEYLDRFYKKSIREKAPIVVTSQGGAPKDIDLYQTQKALYNAGQAVKDGGIVILMGSCIEGFGNETFKQWMLDTEPQDIIDRIYKEFKLGGHKAAAIAMIRVRADIFLVSSMDDELVRRIGMVPFKNVQEAYNEAVNRLGKNSKSIIIPHGGSTLPVFEG